MNPWTALLESLHSSLIDEFNIRKPKCKPELGLPKRLSQWAPPSDEIRNALLCEVAFDGSVGMALLAMTEGCEKFLGLSTQQLWEAVLKRAGSEFMRRSIKPKLQPIQLFALQSGLPQGAPDPKRVIWIPFRLDGHPCFLGVAV